MERLKTLMSKKIVIIACIVFAVIVVLTGVFIALNKKQDATLKKEQVAKVEQEIESAYINYDKAGTYSKKMEYASGEVSVGDVIIENATFDTLEIKDSVGDGSVTLNNCNVNKCFVINGGGTNSVRINGGKYNEVISNKYNCHIVIDKTADIKTLTVPSTALIEIDGKVETCNVLKGDYAGDVTWETGVKLGDNATVTTLNVDEALSADNNATSVVEVSNNNTNAIKSQNTMSSEQVAKVQQTTVAQTQNVSQNAQTQWSNQQQIIASNPNITPANNNTNVTPAGSSASNNSKTPTNSTPTWNNNSNPNTNNASNSNVNTNSGHENWTNIYTTTREAYWENYEITDDVWIPAEYTEYWVNYMGEDNVFHYELYDNLVPGTGCWKVVPTGKWENKYTPEEGFWQNFCF
ncbi:MAG: hypothetical protein K6B67_05875 [Lachnospiraceae bacterium]|nr:hypothetical protein [Lachnospiraceae bacterium]